MTVMTHKRKSIKHLHQMNDLAFIDLLRKHKTHLFPDSIQLKIDGFPIKIGKDIDGNIFLESSKSGPIYEVGSFYSYVSLNTKEQTKEIIDRAKVYDDLLLYAQASNILRNVPNNRKVFIEVLYNDIGIHQDNNITFVHTTYDKTKLGKIATLFPHKIVESDSGLISMNEQKELSDIIGLSTCDIKIMSPYLPFGPITFDATLDLPNDYESILISRKKDYKEKKMNLKNIILNFKHNLEYTILNSNCIKNKNLIGESLEGLVLTFDEIPYKVTTQKFKELIQNT
jgi:hypothetical protein